MTISGFLPNAFSLSGRIRVLHAIREGTAYYVQRQPEELGNIGWVIDRKDRMLTQMEETSCGMLIFLCHRLATGFKHERRNRPNLHPRASCDIFRQHRKI
jgi:hypothetical protein